MVIIAGFPGSADLRLTVRLWRSESPPLAESASYSESSLWRIHDRWDRLLRGHEELPAYFSAG